MVTRARGSHRRMRPWRLVPFVVACLWFVAPAPAGAADEAAPRRWVLFPDAEFYPQYVADPLRAQSALMLVQVTSSDIPDTGDGRFLLRLGGRFPIVRLHPEGQPDRGWQLDFEGGFFGYFDRDHSLDNIGWDGIYGLQLAWLPRPGLGLRIGTRHDSAHVGDEYAERTGRERRPYTREELVVGVSWQPAAGWRVYAEGAHGYDLRDFQEALRLQAGAERFGDRLLWKDRCWLYGAVNVTVYEERDWEPAVNAQAGFAFPTNRGRSRYRVALEVATGRAALGEFSFADETWVGVGWYFDF